MLVTTISNLQSTFFTIQIVPTYVEFSIFLQGIEMTVSLPLYCYPAAVKFLQSFYLFNLAVVALARMAMRRQLMKLVYGLASAPITMVAVVLMPLALTIHVSVIRCFACLPSRLQSVYIISFFSKVSNMVCVQVSQWFSVLAAMAMLSARTWV